MLGEFFIHEKLLGNIRNDSSYLEFSKNNYSSPNECKKQGIGGMIDSSWVGICYGFFASQQNSIGYCQDKGKEEFPGNQGAQDAVNSHCITKYGVDKKDCSLCENISSKFDTQYSDKKSDCFSNCSVLTNQKSYCDLAKGHYQFECKIFLQEISKANILLFFHIILTIFLFTLIIYAIYRERSLFRRIVIFGNGYIIIIGIGSLMIGLRGVYQDAAAPMTLFGIFSGAVALIVFNLIAVIFNVIKKRRNK